jgi:hypothetical protein
MNPADPKTTQAVKTLLNHVVETTRRMVNAKASPDSNPRDAADFPLVDPAYLAAIPERCRPEVLATATRLRAQAASGDMAGALLAVSEETPALVDVLPRGWTLPTSDPAVEASRIP